VGKAGKEWGVGVEISET